MPERERLLPNETEIEIEITEDMIEVGVDVLNHNIGSAINYNWNPHDLASEVYLAMAQKFFELRR